MPRYFLRRQGSIVDRSFVNLSFEAMVTVEMPAYEQEGSAFAAVRRQSSLQFWLGAPVEVKAHVVPIPDQDDVVPGVQA